MKKTLTTIILAAAMALTAGAAEQECAWTSSTTPAQSVGGKYSGIIFTISGNNTRMTTTSSVEGATLTAGDTVTLTSITVTYRNDTPDTDSRVIIQTEDRVYIGIATGAELLSDKVVKFTFGEGLALTVGTAYKAALSNKTHANGIAASSVVGESVIATSECYSKDIAAAGGSLDGSEVNYLGFLTKSDTGAVANQAYAPVVSLAYTTTVTVPDGGSSLTATTVTGASLVGDTLTLTTAIADGSAVTLGSALDLTFADSFDWDAFMEGKDGGQEVAVVLADAGNNALVLGSTSLSFYNSYSGEKNGKYRLEYIPEPTTAALSLLALAGLSARRRRK